ncbi:MAG: hypothetical protein ACAH80_00700 [Alphaproteobacteria bacterium]
METVEFARQGDVKVDRVELLPADLLLQPTVEDGLNVLAYGEVTGHKHCFREPHVKLYSNDNMLFLVIEGKPATLYHEEHDPITFAPGIYRVRRQREWSDKDEKIIIVVD